MPIYEFRCKNCNHVFESLCFKNDGSDHETCPECGQTDSEKLMSAFSSFASPSGLRGLAGSASSACSPRGGFS
ncbi:MAG: zinc ribbon domain-containing protein [Deltaproteobacteria bacterium]|nr:zinc ribbon domain-containing protein [Deltaproteobacteria bacterium]